MKTIEEKKNEVWKLLEVPYGTYRSWDDTLEIFKPENDSFEAVKTVLELLSVYADYIAKVEDPNYMPPPPPKESQRYEWLMDERNVEYGKIRPKRMNDPNYYRYGRNCKEISERTEFMEVCDMLVNIALKSKIMSVNEKKELRDELVKELTTLGNTVKECYLLLAEWLIPVDRNKAKEYLELFKQEAEYEEHRDEIDYFYKRRITNAELLLYTPNEFYDNLTEQLCWSYAFIERITEFGLYRDIMNDNSHFDIRFDYTVKGLLASYDGVRFLSALIRFFDAKGDKESAEIALDIIHTVMVYYDLPSVTWYYDTGYTVLAKGYASFEHNTLTNPIPKFFFANAVYSFFKRHGDSFNDKLSFVMYKDSELARMYLTDSDKPDSEEAVEIKLSVSQIRDYFEKVARDTARELDEINGTSYYTDKIDLEYLDEPKWKIGGPATRKYEKEPLLFAIPCKFSDNVKERLDKIKNAFLSEISNNGDGKLISGFHSDNRNSSDLDFRAIASSRAIACDNYEFKNENNDGGKLMRGFVSDSCNNSDTDFTLKASTRVLANDDATGNIFRLHCYTVDRCESFDKLTAIHDFSDEQKAALKEDYQSMIVLEFKIDRFHHCDNWRLDLFEDRTEAVTMLKIINAGISDCPAVLNLSANTVMNANWIRMNSELDIRVMPLVSIQTVPSVKYPGRYCVCTCGEGFYGKNDLIVDNIDKDFDTTFITAVFKHIMEAYYEISFNAEDFDDVYITLFGEHEGDFSRYRRTIKGKEIHLIPYPVTMEDGTVKKYYEPVFVMVNEEEQLIKSYEEDSYGNTIKQLEERLLKEDDEEEKDEIRANIEKYKKLLSETLDRYECFTKNSMQLKLSDVEIKRGCNTHYERSYWVEQMFDVSWFDRIDLKLNTWIERYNARLAAQTYSIAQKANKNRPGSVLTAGVSCADGSYYCIWGIAHGDKLIVDHVDLSGVCDDDYIQRSVGYSDEFNMLPGTEIEVRSVFTWCLYDNGKAYRPEDAYLLMNI